MSNFFSALDDSDDEVEQQNPKVVNRGLAKSREENTKKVAEASKKGRAPDKHNDRNTKGGRGPRPATRDGKRTYDRRSGTGRGKEIKKDGGGAHNWGNDKNLARDNEGAVFEEEVQVGEEDDAKAEQAAEEPKLQVEEPVLVEEDKTLSYEEYMKQKERPKNEMFAPPKEREVTNEFANAKPVVAVEEDFLVVKGTTGKKKKGVKVVEKQTVDVGFRVAKPDADDQDRRSRRDGDRRGGGRGRGGGDRRNSGGRGRGAGRGRGGGRGRGVDDRGRPLSQGLNVNDSSAFPTL